MWGTQRNCPLHSFCSVQSDGFFQVLSFPRWQRQVGLAVHFENFLEEFVVQISLSVERVDVVWQRILLGLQRLQRVVLRLFLTGWHDERHVGIFYLHLFSQLVEIHVILSRTLKEKGEVGV